MRWRGAMRPARNDRRDGRSERPQIASARIGRRLAGPVLLSTALASLLLAVPPLQGVARQLAHVRPAWVAAAVALELGSCVGFVVIFRLFFDQVPAGVARELAWTEQGSGALLPGGGLGALAVGSWLLHGAGMSTQSIIDRSSALFESGTHVRCSRDPHLPSCETIRRQLREERLSSQLPVHARAALASVSVRSGVRLVLGQTRRRWERR